MQSEIGVIPGAAVAFGRFRPIAPRDHHARLPDSGDRPGLESSRAPDAQLQCPFFAKDPTRHSKCENYILKRLCDVKRHLFRKHQKQLHCPICRDTDFPTHNAYVSHLREGRCQRNTHPPVEGMSDDKSNALRVAKGNGNPESGWEAYFKILFPDHQGPLPSAFTGTQRVGQPSQPQHEVSIERIMSVQQILELRRVYEEQHLGADLSQGLEGSPNSRDMTVGSIALARFMDFLHSSQASSVISRYQARGDEPLQSRRRQGELENTTFTGPESHAIGIISRVLGDGPLPLQDPEHLQVRPEPIAAPAPTSFPEPVFENESWQETSHTFTGPQTGFDTGENDMEEFVEFGDSSAMGSLPTSAVTTEMTLDDAYDDSAGSFGFDTWNCDFEHDASESGNQWFH
jgi:hypothetical protein